MNEVVYLFNNSGSIDTIIRKGASPSRHSLNADICWVAA